MPASSIDDVVTQLDYLIQTARRENSRLGYFPALYRKVTLKVQTGIRDGWFENAERMEQLDVMFANRYLEAIERRHNGLSHSRAWRVAFDAGRSWWPLVLQHLLLGMNAHINLDLGVAAAKMAPGDQLQEIRNDFFRINAILASLIQEVKDELSQIWPLLRFLDQLAGTTEDVIINFSVSRARESAWLLAERLAFAAPSERAELIDRVDRWAAAFGRVIWKPGFPFRALHPLIRLGERGSVSEIIDILL